MKKPLVIFIGLLLVTTTVSAAVEDCGQVFQESGLRAFYNCERRVREADIQAELQVYREQAERDLQEIRNIFRIRREQVESQWDLYTLNREQDKQNLELRVLQMEIRDRPTDEIEVIRDQIREIDSLWRVERVLKDRLIDYYEAREELQESQINLDLIEREIDLRDSDVMRYFRGY